MKIIQFSNQRQLMMVIMIIKVVREDGAVNGGRRLNAFAKSLAQCEMWHPSGGKSGTTFYKTKDDR